MSAVKKHLKLYSLKENSRSQLEETSTTFFHVRSFNFFGRDPANFHTQACVGPDSSNRFGHTSKLTEIKMP